MRTLIDDLLAYSRTTSSERKFKTTSLTSIIEAVKNDFKEIITAKQATIESGEMCDAHIIPFQFHQLMHNLIGNALKFSNPDRPPHMIINSRNIKGSKAKDQNLLSEKEYCHITVTDNGIGFETQYKDHIFEIFKRLHDKEKISGTGIGLTIAKKIVENHNGVIIATGELNKVHHLIFIFLQLNNSECVALGTKYTDPKQWRFLARLAHAHKSGLAKVAVQCSVTTFVVKSPPSPSSITLAVS